MIKLIVSIVLLAVGLVYFYFWFMTDTPSNDREDSAQLTRLIAGSLCLSIGTIYMVRFFKKPSK